MPFAGTFLQKLSVEFFYPGGVRLLNPPSGVKEKTEESGGGEIWLENLAVPGGSVLNGMQRVKTDAFVNDPDLILIQYGVADALNNVSIDCYIRSLHHILEECKKKNVDVILFGPTPVNRGGGAMQWGITRPYATAARGMANFHNVLFIDTAQHLVRWGGAADFQSDAFAGMQLIGDRLKRIFHVPGAKRQVEFQHLNLAAHTDLGQLAFHELMDGTIGSDFSFAGTATHGDKGTVRTVVSIKNQSVGAKEGIIGALSIGGLTPVKPAFRYRIPPGKTASFTFDYRRPVVGKSYEGTDIYYPFEIDDEVVRFPFVIEDGATSEFVDLPLRVGPVSVTWKSKQYINIHNRIQVAWDFANGSQKNLSGTYRVGMGNQVTAPKQFSVAPLGRRKFSETFNFVPPPGVDRFQSEIFIVATVGGKSYRFTRELEASRDLALGEKVAMVSGNQYAIAQAGTAFPKATKPKVWFEADDSDKSGLFVVVDLSGIAVPDISPAIRAELTIDGRNNGVRSFGGVSPIVIYAKGGGGKGYTSSLPLGCLWFRVQHAASQQRCDFGFQKLPTSDSNSPKLPGTTRLGF